MSKSKKAVIVGASSGVGRSIANLLAKNGYSLVLSARDKKDLTIIACDLMIRYKIDCHVVVSDLAVNNYQTDAYFQECLGVLFSVDELYITAGMVHDSDDGFASDLIIDSIININFSNSIKTISKFALFFKEQGHGNVIAFSSIAAGVPRKRNTVYSASKIALENYCKGLQHLLVNTNVKIQFYRLGYVDSAMSYGQKLLFPIESPDIVAKTVFKNINTSFRYGYLPRFWFFIVFLLKCLPWFIYKKLKF